MHHQSPNRSIVFTNTKRAAEEVAGYLLGNGLEAGVLSGDIPQNKRQQLLERFQRGELPILVATDVAARGLHIPDVSHVINFDLPQDGEDYVHRIGRTARIGASGNAISLVCEEYVFSLPDIEEYIEQKIPAKPITDELLMKPKPPKRLARPRTGPQGDRARGRPSQRRPTSARR
jgi:ATP-dependent RNA helicase RhlB